LTSDDKPTAPVAYVRLIADEAEARAELRKIEVDPVSVPIMAPKLRHVVIKIKELDARAANILKQEMLAKGADAAVAKWASGFSRPTTDVLLMATVKQYRLVLEKLKVQPYGLQSLAPSIERALANLSPRSFSVQAGPCELGLGGRTLVMGILNLTPDSFSDGGRYEAVEEAVLHAKAMVEAGADIIDVGGESTRPGARPVDASTETRRILPAVERLAGLGVPISVDTSKAEVAAAAIRAGAAIINDVTALRGDPDMGRVCADGAVGVILMHMRGEPRTMQENPEYRDLVAELTGFFEERLAAAAASGIGADRLMIDPGFGFGKTIAHNLEILKRLREFQSLGCPIVLGTSRKATIGTVLGGLGPDDRVEGTAATVAAGILNGAAIVRVHDVKEMARVAKMTDAVMAGERWDG
jgi:dihydropteroate synthase